MDDTVGYPSTMEYGKEQMFVMEEKIFSVGAVILRRPDIIVGCQGNFRTKGERGKRKEVFEKWGIYSVKCEIAMGEIIEAGHDILMFIVSHRPVTDCDKGSIKPNDEGENADDETNEYYFF
jgi:hypothetical protein